jgi:hypothetical protein
MLVSATAIKVIERHPSTMWLRGAEDVVRRDLSRLVPELRAGPAFVFEGNA